MIKSQVGKKNDIPDAPGVYLFKNKEKILYVGKATSLKDRVKSYFSSDLTLTRGPLLVDMVNGTTKVDFIKTSSVLEALILEANLIKKYQPKYNTKEKDDKSFNYLVITKEDFPRVFIIRGRDLSQGQGRLIKSLPTSFTNVFGPFTSSTQLRDALKIIRKVFPFRDKCKPFSGKPCFNKQLGLCPGICDGTINKKNYRKLIGKIIKFFSGKTDKLKKNLRKEMKILVREQKFEKANEVKKQIFALEHIQDVSLVKNDFYINNSNKFKFRIEAYDVSHLSGTNNVGAMVVMEGGELKRSDYRKFKINNSRGNDIGSLKEILERRLKHPEWPMPKMIVLDGGIAQLNAANEVVKKYQGESLIDLVAVIKDSHHKAKKIFGLKNLSSGKYSDTLLLEYKADILKINNEAHRFVITFHRQRRSVIM